MVCKGELQGLAAELRERKLENMTIVAVSNDKPELLKSWQAFFKDKITFLSDPEERVIGAFGLLHSRGGPEGANTARPATFIIQRDGSIVYSHVAGNVLDRPDPKEILDQITLFAAEQSRVPSRPSTPPK